MAEVNLDIAMQSTSEEILRKVNGGTHKYVPSATVQYSNYSTEQTFGAVTVLYNMTAEYDGEIVVSFGFCSAGGNSYPNGIAVLTSESTFHMGVSDGSTSIEGYSECTIDVYQMLNKPTGTSIAGTCPSGFTQTISPVGFISDISALSTYTIPVKVKKGDKLSVVALPAYSDASKGTKVKNLKIMYDLEEV